MHSYDYIVLNYILILLRIMKMLYLILEVRRLAKSVTFLCRNASEYSWKNSGFEVRSGVASACRLPKCPTLQRIPTNRDVNEREKPYSTFKIEHDRTRIQEMWQRSRIGAREQVCYIVCQLVIYHRSIVMGLIIRKAEKPPRLSARQF